MVKGTGRRISAGRFRVGTSMPPKSYRVPCPCGTEIGVAAGLAGGRTVCPSCGRSLDVPRLRDLQACVAADDATVSLRRWRSRHAWMLVGTSLAVAAAASAVVVGRRVNVGPSVAADTAAIQSADTVTVHRAWQAMRWWGVDRGALPEELRSQRAAATADGIGRLLWALAGVGAVVAVAAALCGLAPVVSAGDRREASPSRGGSP